MFTRGCPKTNIDTIAKSQDEYEFFVEFDVSTEDLKHFKTTKLMVTSCIYHAIDGRPERLEKRAITARVMQELFPFATIHIGGHHIAVHFGSSLLGSFARHFMITCNAPDWN